MGYQETGMPEEIRREIEKEETEKEAERQERLLGLVQQLQQEGGKFIVERSEEVQPGQHKQEFSWQIESADAERVVVVEPEQKLKKEIPLESFMKSQADWASRIYQSVLRGKQQEMEAKGLRGAAMQVEPAEIQTAYDRAGIGEIVEKMRDEEIRKITGT